LINKKGEKIFGDSISVATDISEGKVGVSKMVGEERKYALARVDGSFLTDFVYDDIRAPFRGGYFVVERDSTTAFLDREGKWFRPVDLPFYNRCEYGIGRIQDHFWGQKTCYITLQGEIILPLEQRGYTQVEGGMIKVRTGGSPWNHNETFEYYHRNGEKPDLSDYDEVYQFQLIRLE
jgi:hypothetical protein